VELIGARPVVLGLAAAVLFGGIAATAAEMDSAPSAVTFPTRDGGLVSGILSGRGERGVVLAHGGRFRKESWERETPALVRAYFPVLAIDFRGYGKSRGPGAKDPLSNPLRATAPKKLVLLEGSAHAQFIFETDQGPRLLQEIIDFLTEP